MINHLFALDVSSLPPLVLNEGSLSSSSLVSSDDHLNITPLRDELHLIDRMNSADLQSLFASMTALNAVSLPEPVQHDLPSLLSRTTATSSDGDTVSTLNSFLASIVSNGSHDRDPLNHSSNFSVPTAAHDCNFLSPAV